MIVNPTIPDRIHNDSALDAYLFKGCGHLEQSMSLCWLSRRWRRICYESQVCEIVKG
jgi:hypothetical protein